MHSIDLTDPTFAYDDTDPPGFRVGCVRPGGAWGAQETGVSLYELRPGEAVCPYHFECAEEEWAMPLDGPVTVRTPDGSSVLPAMHLVFFPMGPDGAHQLANDGDASVRVLMFGQRKPTAATVYPDSGKVGVWGPGIDREHALYRMASAVEYYDGEQRGTPNVDGSRT